MAECEYVVRRIAGMASDQTPRMVAEPPFIARYVVGPLEFAPEEMSVVVAGRRVWLTRRELAVLRVLAEHARRPVARDEIRQRVWGGRVSGFKDRSVEVYIRRLRVKLAEAGPEWEYIHTHHAVGYRLEPEPREARS
jgi:DNA-binding response OmpR family regulator